MNRTWRVVGWVVTGLFAVVGLAALAFVVFFVIAINSWGSNK